MLLSVLAHGAEAAEVCQGKLALPGAWKGLRSEWVMPCEHGGYNGVGVLKGFRGGTLEKTFFGRIDGGVMTLGVVDNVDGTEIIDTRPAAPDGEDVTRQRAIDAFAVASQAAAKLSQFYAQQHNKASSDYYQKKAEALAETLD